MEIKSEDYFFAETKRPKSTPPQLKKEGDQSKVSNYQWRKALHEICLKISAHFDGHTSEGYPPTSRGQVKGLRTMDLAEGDYRDCVQKGAARSYYDKLAFSVAKSKDYLEAILVASKYNDRKAESQNEDEQMDLGHLFNGLKSLQEEIDWTLTLTREIQKMTDSSTKKRSIFLDHLVAFESRLAALHLDYNRHLQDHHFFRPIVGTSPNTKAA